MMEYDGVENIGLIEITCLEKFHLAKDNLRVGVTDYIIVLSL